MSKINQNKVGERIIALEIKMDEVLIKLSEHKNILDRIYEHLFEKGGGEESIAFTVKQNKKEISQIKKEMKKQENRRYSFKSKIELYLVTSTMGIVYIVIYELLKQLIKYMVN